MKVRFILVNRERQLFNCYLLGKAYNDNYQIKARENSRSYKNENSRVFLINSYQLYFFFNEIDNCPTFKYNLAMNIKSISDSPFIIQLIPNKIEYIDRIWGEIVRTLCWEQIEIEYMLSWLSTLGGGFSALGDYFEDRAEIAGKIAIYQMKLAIRIGDPNLLTRCKLYLSISLIQQNRFKLAQRIIRNEYEFAKTVEDSRLRKMCLGIWAKLQYSHKMFRENRKRLKRQKM